MTEKIRAKFYVTSKIPSYGDSVVIGLSAVYSDKADSTNKKFTDATPSGQINIQIAKGKEVGDKFIIGQNYYVDFTETEKE